MALRLIDPAPGARRVPFIIPDYYLGRKFSRRR